MPDGNELTHVWQACLYTKGHVTPMCGRIFRTYEGYKRFAESFPEESKRVLGVVAITYQCLRIED